MDIRRQLRLLSVFVVIFASGVIWIRTATVKNTYLFVKQEREYRRLQQEIQAQRVRWLKQTAPRRLETMAGRLGLNPPKPTQILRYEPETQLQASRLP